MGFALNYIHDKELFVDGFAFFVNMFRDAGANKTRLIRCYDETYYNLY